MPRLDAFTLLTVSSLVLSVQGTAFVAKWWGDRSARWMLDWGLAFLMIMSGTLLLALRGSIPDVWSISAANCLILIGYGHMLAGIHRFDGEPPVAAATWGGGVAWVVLCQWPTFMARFDLRVVALSLFCACYGLVAAASFQSHRRQMPLASRPWVTGLLALGAGLMLVRGAVMAIAPGEARDLQSAGAEGIIWLGLVFLTITVLLALFLLTLSAERVNQAQQVAAERDDLTGVLNRRAFVERARTRLTTAPERGTLMFLDLDHFKSINDTHGHAHGDEVLIAFARLVERRIGPDDLFARWGGEEFVLFLVDHDFIGGRRVADEIRRDLTALAMGDDERAMGITVSVGLAAPALTGPDLDHLIACADAGVYAAKRAGRDRVEVVDPEVMWRRA